MDATLRNKPQTAQSCRLQEQTDSEWVDGSLSGGKSARLLEKSYCCPTNRFRVGTDGARRPAMRDAREHQILTEDMIQGHSPSVTWIQCLGRNSQSEQASSCGYPLALNLSVVQSLFCRITKGRICRLSIRLLHQGKIYTTSLF